MNKYGKRYSDELKWEVIRKVITGDFTKEEVSKRYGIAGNSTVLEWMRKEAGQKSSKDNYSKESQEFFFLRQEMERKDRQLNYFQLKSEALEEMLTRAEKEYGIAIRKKRGAKRSKK